MKRTKHFYKLGIPEYNTQFFDASRDGDLLVKEGNYQYNIHDLVKKYGTPLEVMFPFILEHRVEELIDTFNRYIRQYKYKGKFFYHYPMKVNQNKEFLIPLITEGANLETTSANELWLVKRMWEQSRFNSRIKVICNGPKTPRYIELIHELRDAGLSIVPIIEDISEIEALKRFKGEVGVRVDLDVKVNSHWDKKIRRFGLFPDEVFNLGRIRNLTTLHYHMGSEMDTKEDLIAPLKRAMSIYIKLKETNPQLDTLDIGGGFAVNFEKKKRKYSVPAVAQRVISTLQRMAQDAGVQEPNIIAEWGWHIVAPAQLTLYTIIQWKAIPKATAKKWYIIDGSFITDLLDTWSIHRKWHVTPVNHLWNKKMARVWLAGLSCDADDKYTEGGSYILLPDVEALDSDEPLVVAVYDTGGYQDAFANHHCLLSSPAKIVCQNGEITIARRRESAEEVGRRFGW